MKAELIHRFRDITSEGAIIEMVVWRTPEPVPPATHGFKYRLVYVVNGERIVGFDNERGKGDHYHLDGRQQPYSFATVEQLIEDFIAAVEQRRSP